MVLSVFICVYPRPVFLEELSTWLIFLPKLASS